MLKKYVLQNIIKKNNFIQIIKIYMNYNPHYHAISFKMFILKDFLLIAYILVFMIWLNNILPHSIKKS